MKISVVVDLSSYGVIFSVWISRNKKLNQKFIFIPFRWFEMEDLAESELLEDESDSDLLAYQRLAFGRLRLADEHEQTGSNRFSEISPRVTYRVQTVPSKHVQYLFEFCPSRLKKYFFYKIFGNLPQIQSPFYLPLFWPRAVSPKNVLPLSRIKGMN